MWRIGLLVVIVGACRKQYPVYVTPPGAVMPVRRELPAFGVALEVPANATLEQDDTTAFITNGTFKLNLFVVHEGSAMSAAEKKARLVQEPGFVKFTTEEDRGSAGWRIDYELSDGLAGTIVRTQGVDCGVHGVPPAIAREVAAACATAAAIR
jgi:hypothetical protein